MPSPVRLNRRVAERMVNNFHTFRGQATRHFAGLPFYIGHPDHPAFSNRDTDSSAYGWIMDLVARADGLALEMKWNEQGHEIIANATYKFFSPHW